MTKLFQSFLRGSAMAFCLTALLGTVAHAQVQQVTGKGKMVLSTAQGQTSYTHRSLSTIADLQSGSYKFYFKAHGFRSGQKAADRNLASVLDADNYPVISFLGSFTNPVTKPAEGKTGIARLKGTLTYQGHPVQTELVATTRTVNGKLVLETHVNLNPKGNILAGKAAQELGVTKPIALTVSAAY